MRLGRVWVSRNEEWSRADAGIDGHKAGDTSRLHTYKSAVQKLE